MLGSDTKVHCTGKNTRV